MALRGEAVELYLADYRAEAIIGSSIGFHRVAAAARYAEGGFMRTSPEALVHGGFADASGRPKGDIHKQAGYDVSVVQNRRCP
ncbi:hypothetical protein [Streptomyces spectabilis]|uniref:Uncharacterized protein n=1 Tax=Streptomyces spectabilis TaxID=68270 RepID=A0A7W8EYB1_STRST|nr:hypothetical protein [Streptomyces spectabilis]MBB5107924.1 hypothetical protein [Streptomyces spectabilis]MCI3899746.1 hypothetical protein [Streptomyces spectabilis]GGV52080.1 hypothetical protein GCM10010245_82000 [Streptomyces spectabilis]